MCYIKKLPSADWHLGVFTALLATGVIATTTTVITAVSATITATAAAEDDEDKDDYPAAIVSAEVTHSGSPLFSFLTTYYVKRGKCVTR